METTVKHFRVDANNGLSYNETIPAFEKYFASKGKTVSLPKPFTPETVEIGLSRYYDLNIAFNAELELPKDDAGNLDLENDPVGRFNGETVPGDLTDETGFEDETQTDDSTTKQTKLPTSIATKRIELTIPTEEVRKIIKNLTGVSFPRMPGEFKDGATQDVNISANLGYYLDGGLCAEWKEVVTSD